jgi:xanthine dehydrogenase accessory factor
MGEAMEGLDTLVLRTVQDWQADGTPMVLVTVARTWGSSPRPPGSLMAINDQGATVGSMSGACIEDDLIDKVRRDGIQALPSLPLDQPAMTLMTQQY